jgi:hypothetical protein
MTSFTSTVANSVIADIGVDAQANFVFQYFYDKKFNKIMLGTDPNWNFNFKIIQNDVFGFQNFTKILNVSPDQFAG